MDKLHMSTSLAAAKRRIAIIEIAYGHEEGHNRKIVNKLIQIENLIEQVRSDLEAEEE
ncbi:MAG: hypothetical protein Q4F05_11360 [bacterium]|nr:hypothetical protein [bacterium]